MGREGGEHRRSTCLEAESETQISSHIIYGDVFSGKGVRKQDPLGKEEKQTCMWFQLESNSVWLLSMNVTQSLPYIEVRGLAFCVSCELLAATIHKSWMGALVGKRIGVACKASTAGKKGDVAVRGWVLRSGMDSIHNCLLAV